MPDARLPTAFRFRNSAGNCSVRQQHSELGREARAGLVLEHALDQDTFDGNAILDEPARAVPVDSGYSPRPSITSSQFFMNP